MTPTGRLTEIKNAFEKAIARRSDRRAVLRQLLEDIKFCELGNIPTSLTFRPSTGGGRLFTLTAGVNTEILFASLDGSVAVNCCGTPPPGTPAVRHTRYAAAGPDQYTLAVDPVEFSKRQDAIASDHRDFIDRVSTRRSDGDRVKGASQKTVDPDLIEYAEYEVAEPDVRYAILMYDPEKDPEVARHFHDGPAPDLDAWSPHRFRTLRRGDIVFLRRTGKESHRGFVGLGQIARDQSEQENGTLLQIDWAHVQSEPLILRTDPRVSNIDGLWTPSPGGIELSEDVGLQLLALLRGEVEQARAQHRRERSAGQESGGGRREPSSEGDPYEAARTEYFRDRSLRDACIEEYGCRCFVCQMTFVDTYGAELGESFIHIHHRDPISKGPRETDPKNDLVPVCPNCHAMLHRKLPDGKCLTAEELRGRLRSQVRNGKR